MYSILGSSISLFYSLDPEHTRLNNRLASSRMSPCGLGPMWASVLALTGAPCDPLCWLSEGSHVAWVPCGPLCWLSEGTHVAWQAG